MPGASTIWPSCTMYSDHCARMTPTIHDSRSILNATQGWTKLHDAQHVEHDRCLAQNVMAKRIIGDLHSAVARDVRVPLAINVLQYLRFTGQMGTAHGLCGDDRSIVTRQSLTRIKAGSMMICEGAAMAFHGSVGACRMSLARVRTPPQWPSAAWAQSVPARNPSVAARRLARHHRTVPQDWIHVSDADTARHTMRRSSHQRHGPRRLWKPETQGLLRKPDTTRGLHRGPSRLWRPPPPKCCVTGRTQLAWSYCRCVDSRAIEP